MPRKGPVPRRELPADPIHHSVLVTQLVNKVLVDGKRSVAEWEREHDPRFIRLRQRHSAVESAINALEAHGLDLCPDHGLDGFKRYVAMAVVARNLHRLGAILLAAEAEQERRRQRRAA